MNVLNYLIFYLFWGGVYHSPYYVSNHGYFYNFYGYLVILILLILEKNGQLWALNRFGCTQEKAAFYKDIETHLAQQIKLKQTLEKEKINLAKSVAERLPL